MDLEFMDRIMRLSGRNQSAGGGAGSHSNANDSRLAWNVMSRQTDTAEHSGEMQYPYIKYCLDTSGRARDVKVAVMMV